MDNSNVSRQLSGLLVVNKDPSRATVVRRLRNVYESTPENLREEGMNWYGSVHEAASKAARAANRSTRQASGVVAAVSPNMDWERNNINAFDEISSLKPEHWDAIQKSDSQPQVRNAQGKMVKAPRTQQVREILSGMSLSSSPDSNLIKAHKIWNLGEDPEAVLPRRSAPKTNSFFRNINAPHVGGDVTVDGRHADLIADAMRPWSGEGAGRGIQSAALPSGKRTRYEDYEEHTRSLAKNVGILPHELQAVVWTGAKPIERGFDSARAQGDARTGQSYQRRLREFHAGRG
jgi:hypothetical protein